MGSQLLVTDSAVQTAQELLQLVPQCRQAYERCVQDANKLHDPTYQGHKADAIRAIVDQLVSALGTTWSTVELASKDVHTVIDRIRTEDLRRNSVGGQLGQLGNTVGGWASAAGGAKDAALGAAGGVKDAAVGKVQQAAGWEGQQPWNASNWPSGG